MSKNWYDIKAQAAGGSISADVYIFDYIGGWDVSARGFINELKALDTDQINLHINSPGGSVFDGVAIQNSLKHHKATIMVFIDGIAASIASIIALAGDEVKIADNAYVMIHNPASIVWGEAKDLLKEAEVLDKLADGLAGDYSRKMGITTAEARALMDEETWYLGAEAVEAGFADATFEGSQATASFDLARVSAKAPKEAINRFASVKKTQEKFKKKEAEMADEIKETTTEATETETTTASEIETETESTTTAEQATPTDVQAAVQVALAADRKRAAAIEELGEKFGFSTAAKKFKEDVSSVAAFQAHILEKSPEDWQASLSIKNPSVQRSEQELEDGAAGADAVATIKARRQARLGK